MSHNSLLALAPLLTVVMGLALYQVSLKKMSVLDSPFQILALVYTFSALLALVLSHVFPSKLDTLHILRHDRYWVALISVATVMIEGGYLWAFRAGWLIAPLNVFVSVLCLLVMLAVGFFVFGERVTGVQLLGIVLCASGFILVAK